MEKKSGLGFLIVLFIFSYVTPQAAIAHHRAEVLGETTQASELDMPGVAAGPGLFLPDSPFYFLDKFVQGVRLATAYTPENKAKIRSAVAQERMAELRVMLARNEEEGIKRALDELTHENEAAAASLKEASARGKDVSNLARQMNEAIKTQRNLLAAVSQQAKGTLKLQLEAAREELKEAKITVEDELTEDELAREIEEGLREEARNNFVATEHDLIEIERDIDLLQMEATNSSKVALAQREKALKEAIEQRNTTLAAENERLLREERVKQEFRLKVRQDAADALRKQVREARDAAKQFEAMHREG